MQHISSNISVPFGASGVRNVCDETLLKFRIEMLRPRTSSFRLVMHGLIEDRYGHDLVIRALPIIRESIPGITLDIIGEGSCIDNVLILAEYLSCRDLITYHSFVPYQDMIAILRNSDLGIVALKRSPYSVLVDTNKMYDYIMLGLPFIASHLPVIASTFSAKSIRYFEPGNIKEIADAVIELYANPLECLLMRNSAFSELEAISWQKQQKVYLSLFRKDNFTL